MSRLLVASCFLALVVIAAHAAPQDRFENVNVEEVLGNDRLLKAYIQCLLEDGDGKCTKEGKDLKKLIPRLVETGCGECSPKQLENSVKVLKHVTEKNPGDWVKLKAKYDPDGKYAKMHAETWKQRGVNF